MLFVIENSSGWVLKSTVGPDLTSSTLVRLLRRVQYSGQKGWENQVLVVLNMGWEYRMGKCPLGTFVSV